MAEKIDMKQTRANSRALGMKPTDVGIAPNRKLETKKLNPARVVIAIGKSAPKPGDFGSNGPI